jgi:hypothetical protein
MMLVQKESGFEQPGVNPLAFRRAGLNPLPDRAGQPCYLFLQQFSGHAEALPSFRSPDLVANDSM